jgi:cytochrome P450
MQLHDPGPIPDHVPEHLVDHDFPLKMGSYSEEDPFARIVPEACEGPDVIFAANIVPGGGHAWVLRRFEDLKNAYNDTEHFSNKGFSGLSALIGESWHLVPAEQDAPEHTDYRRMLNPVFAPGSIAKMDGDVRAAAQDCMKVFEGKTECDFIQSYAASFPVGVVLRLMQLPQERMNDFMEWESMLLHSGKFEVMQEGVRNVSNYLREVIAQRKANPGDDLISYAIKATPGGRKMTDDELLGYAFNFYIGGLDTVTANLGNFMRHLATNLDDQRALREDPSKIRGAIEEFMRAFAAVTTQRVCIKEKVIRGVTIKEGDIVSMVTTLAGRDKDVYDNPHEVDISRNPRHVSFAIGPHNCLGVHLARRELRIALEELLAGLPEFRLNPDIPVKAQVGGIIQPRNLPLVWG